MARARTHKDVEFAVDDASGNQRTFRTFDAAAGFAIGLAINRGEPVNIDVLVYSRAAAKWWLGEYGAEVYDEDPEASVFQRVRIRADDQGRIA